MPKTATSDFVETLHAALPEGTFRVQKTGELDDPRGRHQGLSAIVAMPRTVLDV